MSAAAQEAPPPGAAAAAQGGDAQEHHQFANPTAAAAAPRTSLLGPRPPLRPPRALSRTPKLRCLPDRVPSGRTCSSFWQLFLVVAAACPFLPFLPNEPLHSRPGSISLPPGAGAGLDTLAKEKRAEREAAAGGPKRALTSMLDDPDATQVRRHPQPSPDPTPPTHQKRVK